MIEKLFNKPGYPIILNDSLLKRGDNKYIPLSKLYLFIKTRYIKVEEVGSSWIVNSIGTERQFKGYFYSTYNNLDILDNEEFEIDMMISGNIGNMQYQVSGVSITKTNNHFGQMKSFNVSKFSALSCEIIKI